MHLLLTDRLTCPRCGPEFGLVLLADELVERRVLRGALGCPNCRDRFPVRDGFGDLRAPPRTALAEPTAATAPGAAAEEAARLAALLGVVEGPGNLALVGPLAAHADALADLIPDVEVVAVDAGAAATPERPGVSRMVAWPDLPFRAASFRAVALSGEHVPGLLAEAARVVVPRGRVVARGAASDAQLEAAGLALVARDPLWVVGARQTR